MSDGAELSDILLSTGDPDRSLDERREDARHRAAVDRADIERGRHPFFYAQPVESDLRIRLKRALAQDIKQCRWSREQIAEALSRLIGRSITLVQVDAWVAETKEHRLPVEYVPAWLRVTGSTRVLELLCAEAGMWLAADVDHDLAEYGRSVLQQQELQQRAESLAHSLKGKI